MKKALVILALAAASVGCSNESSEFNVSAFLRPPLSIESMSVLIDDGKLARTFTAPEFQQVSALQYNGPTIRVPDAGTLVVIVTFLSPDGVTRSEGRVDIDLRKDWISSIVIVADTTDPRALFMGSLLRTAKFGLNPDLRSAAADSVYLLTFGQSKSERGRVY